MTQIEMLNKDKKELEEKREEEKKGLSRLERECEECVEVLKEDILKMREIGELVKQTGMVVNLFRKKKEMKVNYDDYLEEKVEGD